MSSDELKTKGNAAFAAKNYDEAIDFFSQGIAIDPNNHVLFSNRSACHAGKQNWAQAVEDADKCISIKPDWVKGYGRKGAALHGKGDLEGAYKAYKAGLAIQPGLAMLSNGIAKVEVYRRLLRRKSRSLQLPGNRRRRRPPSGSEKPTLWWSLRGKRRGKGIGRSRGRGNSGKKSDQRDGGQPCACFQKGQRNRKRRESARPRSMPTIFSRQLSINISTPNIHNRSLPQAFRKMQVLRKRQPYQN